jgi:hypothetical protein
MLSWIIENELNTGTQAAIEDLAQQINHLNFVALHSTAGVRYLSRLATPF